MKKLFRQFFYVPKHAAVPERVFLARTTLSLVSVLLCVVMLCATTLAWFSDSSATPVSPVQSAEYSANVNTQAGSQLIADEETGVSTYACRSYAPGDRYTFVLTGAGNAETGYCQITVSDSDGENTYSTDLLLPGEDMTLSVQTAPGAIITFTPSWGAGVDSEPQAAFFAQYDAPERETIYGDGDTIYVSESAWVEYLVDNETVTLEDLAAFYGVDPQDILDYNGISWLELGQTLRIPDPLTFDPFPSPSDGEDGGESDDGSSPDPDSSQGGTDGGGASDGGSDDSGHDDSGSDDNGYDDSGLSDWEQNFYGGADSGADDTADESWSLWE